MPPAERAAHMQSFERTMEICAKFLQEQHGLAGRGWTKLKEPPDIYIQKAVPDMSDSTRAQDHELIARAIRDLRRMLDAPRGEWDVDVRNRAFRDMVFELERKYTHKERFRARGGGEGRVFDSEMTRLERRNATRTTADGETFRNCLVVRRYNPRGAAVGGVAPPEEDYTETTYFATRVGAGGECEGSASAPTMWCGDGYVTAYDPAARAWTEDPLRGDVVDQTRAMRQSRLFITYSLHRAVTSEHEGRLVLERMADAAHELFGSDQNLSELLVFGYRLAGFGSRQPTPDTISKARFEVIPAPNKKDRAPSFYGESGASSYIYDTYETHVEAVDVDGGVEIGPSRRHPHFHVLLTITHWSYVQIDYLKMNAYLELMFRGRDPLHRGWGERFKLLDASGGLFYTDNESPHVDIKLYPQDNWSEVVAAYVRKNATPGIMEALGARTERARRRSA